MNCLGEHVAGGLHPSEGMTSLVPVLHEALDRGDEHPHALEGAAADRLARQDREPRFDLIHPRGARRREVQVEAAMALEPGLDHRVRVRGVVD